MSIDCGSCGVVLRRTPGLDIVVLHPSDLERDDGGAFLRCPCCGNKERHDEERATRRSAGGNQ